MVIVMYHRTSYVALYFPVYADGRVCISILHSPGDDPLGYETSAERWSPVQSVEKILLSVVSMLAGELCQWKMYIMDTLGPIIFPGQFI